MDRQRMARLALLAALLGTLSAAPGAADTHLGGSGRVGRHALRDTVPGPGARCTYSDAAGVLQTIRVRPPAIRARDVTAARDHQQVSWLVRIQYWDINGFWATASTAGPWGAVAWDDQPAALTAQTIAAPIGMGGRYRAVVVMRWHRAGAVEGTSRHRVDWVRHIRGNAWVTVGPQGSCPEMLAD